jgi:hypothetical protein|tara:strand:+ start:1577 stop:1963 length:387 start_codon:yes stop_codon:yes gene_type:complete
MINVEEISQIVNKRNRMKKETYTELYKQITRKIRRAVETGRKKVVTQIPSFVVGYPTFDRMKALSYLKRQLEIAGFDIIILGEYELSITWKVKKINRDSSVSETMEDFPTLVNLKKAANHYRRNAQNA